MSSPADALFEADVIDAVCTHLQGLGYEIRQKLTTTQRGDDIIAFKCGSPDRLLIVEAKGATSSRTGSPRSGQPFDSAQVLVHVAEAVFKALQVLARSRASHETKAAIALPDNALHRRYLATVAPVIEGLGIAVFLVADRFKVDVQSPWDL